MEFFAVDGEAIDDNYVLLAGSDGSHITPAGGSRITTIQCLEYLLSKASKARVLVCFGLNYDVNQWVADLKRPELEALWKSNFCTYAPNPKVCYTIKWLPRHWCEITKLDISTGAPVESTVRICEVWGFFQSSFVAALGAWGLSVPDHMESMKSQRGEFKQSDWDKMVSYCHSECTSLAELMDALRAACIEAAIVPSRWIGAGALASSLLNKHKWLIDHHKHDDELMLDPDPIMRAYFGGRVDAFQIGDYHRQVASVDIRSAYPYAATHLPSLAHARMTKRKRFDPNSHGVWKVSWECGSESGVKAKVMPFPVRFKGNIYYPTVGVGWYHTVEVTTAMNAGYNIKVHEGFVLKQSDDLQPFHWIPASYNLREKWKNEKRAAEKVLKLSLNSVYGKLAQGVGYNGSLGMPMKSNKPKPPRWQSYFWAGEITARTRARLLEIMLGASNLLMISTDGVFAGSVKARDRKGLGGLERNEYDRMFIARPGVYLLEKDGQEDVVRSRGFRAKDVDFHEIREFYAEHGITSFYEYSSRKFIGIGAALQRKDFKVWRTWEPQSRKLHFLPAAKRVDVSTGECFPYDELLPESEAFVPKDYVMDDDEIVESDQPLTTE